MTHKFSILYSWMVRIITFVLPDAPIFMRLRGFLYSLGMNRCGRNFQVCSTAYLNSLAGLKVGGDVYIAHNTVVIGTDIELGDAVIIGPNCVISGGNHQFSSGSFRFSKSSSRPVSIGSGCWVAANCTVTGGSRLPPSSILAAGAVLTRQYIEELAVYRGVPAVFSHYHNKVNDASGQL